MGIVFIIVLRASGFSIFIQEMYRWCSLLVRIHIWRVDWDRRTVTSTPFCYYIRYSLSRHIRTLYCIPVKLVATSRIFSSFFLQEISEVKDPKKSQCSLWILWLRLYVPVCTLFTAVRFVGTNVVSPNGFLHLYLSVVYWFFYRFIRNLHPKYSGLLITHSFN
jgi:hypothetical protein